LSLFEQSVPFISPLSEALSLAGFWNYLLNYHKDLAPKGVYVRHFSVGIWIKPGTDADPDIIADS
jgi:hypothetical protein